MKQTSVEHTEGSQLIPSVRRLERDMSRTCRNIAVLVGVSIIAGCHTWRSPLSFEARDVAEPEVQNLLRLAARPERQLQGFSPLPTAGKISVARLKPFRAPEPGWETVVLSAFIQSETWSRAWYFGGGHDKLALLCETETIHSHNLVTAADVNDGKPFREYLEIEFAAEDACARPAGYRVRHVGAGKARELSLPEGLQLARGWFPSHPKGE
jgi:hypothetical protein